MRRRAIFPLPFLIVVACSSAVVQPTAGPTAHPTPQPSETTAAAVGDKGIFNLDHLVFIVMENRSFDHYFGTYPGADGIPKNTCVPDPMLGHCVDAYHSTELTNRGGPHGMPHAIADANGDAMDGFVSTLEKTRRNDFCLNDRMDPSCTRWFGPQGQPDVMGYHDRREIPNYWKYADNFVLQDRMFESVDSWTLPSHLFLVSGWSATCSDPGDPMSCTSDPAMLGGNAQFNPGLKRRPPYAWTDITYLLKKGHVSWRYYVAPGTCFKNPCGGHNIGTPKAMSPLPGFATVRHNHQLHNIAPHPSLFRAAEKGNLPSVSWVIPGRGYSEHPTAGSIATGQAFVTTVINKIMESPNWDSSAIFLTWDDWGGFYDHVKPPAIDGAGYGFRVPGLMISPYAKSGFIDHQTLSSDAYLKLIEDRFLDGQRLDPKTDGRPDPRPTVRENVKQLGNLRKEFDFHQDPLPPLILDPTPFGDRPSRTPIPRRDVTNPFP